MTAMPVHEAAQPFVEAPDQRGRLLRTGTGRPWLVLAVLFVVAVFNYVDRTILSILQVPIKAELGLSDAQLGALTGLAFALFYTTLALPIGRLADRATRKTTIAASIFIWSAMTAGTAFVNSFLSLVAMRIGVAVGEAGSVPATHSMISDMFPIERRATAMSVWGMCYPVGTMLGFAGGGWLAANVGWRHAFFWIGAAGVIAAPLLLVAIREPLRGRHDPPRLAHEDVPTTREAVRHLWSSRCFRSLVLASALAAYVQNAMMAWNAPFYARVHAMPLASIAGWLAAINGIGSAIGILLSGNLSDWLGRRFVRGYLVAPAAGTLALGPVGLIQYGFAPATVSLVLGILSTMLVMLYYSCVVSVSHSLMPPRMRAFTSAMIVLIVNLIGLGLGPLLTGFVSDLLGGGASGLRWSLMVAMLPAPVAAWLFWNAANALARELPAMAG